MASPASIKGRPIHPTIVSLPIGLWVFSLACDLIFALGWGGAVWHEIAFYTMAGGIIAALLAAVPGLVDFLSLSDITVKKLGVAHLSLNLLIVGVFILNLWLRTTSESGALLPVALSVLAIVLLATAGWLGGVALILSRFSCDHADGFTQRA